jgi:hypothetical protein
MACYDDALDGPAFRDLDPARKVFFRDMMSKIAGKSPIEALAVIAAQKDKMPEGRDLTRAEQRAMINAALEGMEPRDRDRFRRIISLAGLG